MTTYLKVVLQHKTEKHIYCTIYESENGENWQYNGDLSFGRETYWAFKDCLLRGRGQRTEVVFEDRDLQERIDWEIANRRQS